MVCQVESLIFHTAEENGHDLSSYSKFGSVIAFLVAATNQTLQTSGKQTAQSRLSVTVAAYHYYQTKPAGH